MLKLRAQIEEAVAAIREKFSADARFGIILGTGLGGLGEEIDEAVRIPYEDIPHFPVSTAVGHSGHLVCGTYQGAPVVAMEGRFHSYEGYSYQQITFPVRVMKSLGANTLIVSNACGGLNPQYEKGDLMVIEDHINLMTGNPLCGVNDDSLGPRFPDMKEPYSLGLLAQAQQIAMDHKIRLQKGVYVAVTGPNLETRAEYRFLRMIGADVVGMSTVPEVIVAAHSSMKVLGLSIVTDMCLPDALAEVDVAEILAVAAEAEPKLRTIVRETVANNA